jgi:hypothetical protein
MLFDDVATYSNLGFKHDDVEEQSADKKALELLKNSPYAQKLDSAGLFLRVLALRGSSLPGLLSAHLGNPIAVNGEPTRLTDIMNRAPQLDMNKLDQIAALPLGGRVKLNPWDNKVDLIKAAPVALTSIREKMPFEVTPFFPRLSRLKTETDASVAASAAVPSTTVAAAGTPAATTAATTTAATSPDTSSPSAPTTRGCGRRCSRASSGSQAPRRRRPGRAPGPTCGWSRASHRPSTTTPGPSAPGLRWPRSLRSSTPAW